MQFRHSIRFKLTSILIVTVLSILVVVSAVNLAFAETFYYNFEQENIVSTFHKVDDLFKKNLSSDVIEEELWQITQKTSVRIVVVDPLLNFYDQQPLYATTYLYGDNYDAMINYLKQVSSYPIIGGDDTTKMLVDGINENGYAVAESRVRNLRRTSDIFLFGRLDNGYMTAMQIPMESMQATVKIFTQFLAYIAMIAVVFGATVMYLVSRNFTRPIKEMADVAQRMTKLDFDAKVTNISPDELGDLGIYMNDMSSKLEQTISELKTANNELRKDIDKRAKIDDMRKEFLSHVSHELKTPIALIQGYAEGLKENISDDEESREFYCEVIADEADKMNKMVKKLLDLNEIEFGQDKVHMERFDVVDLLKNLTASSAILFQKKNVTLEFDAIESIYVWADEFMIEEVLSNYISNALNHVTEGGTIRIRFEEKHKNVRIFVYNTGKHIPEEDIDKIWIKFFKVDKARTREYGGSGIGLSIVAATMDAHGKSYGMNNVEGGVEFYIDLDMNL